MTLAKKILQIARVTDPGLLHDPRRVSEFAGLLAGLIGAPLAEVAEVLADLPDCSGDCDREIGCTACESTWSSAP
jgi:hypothetical protein